MRENIGVGPMPAAVVAYWVNLDDVHQILDCAYNDVGWATRRRAADGAGSVAQALYGMLAVSRRGRQWPSAIRQKGGWMEQIAIISDLHGTIPALEAVLSDIDKRQIKRVMCLGDLVGKGPHSARAVDLCREACEPTVMGNWDAFICRETENPMALWHRQQLGPERLQYLAQLPTTVEFLLSGKRVRLFHASQVSIFHRVHMYDTRENHAAMFDNTLFTGDAMVPDVVGYGDIHSAYQLSLHRGLLFNVGSVGNPLDIPLAAYAIAEGVYGSAAPAPFSIALVRVPYDIERAVADAEEAQMPDLLPYVNELRTAIYRGAKSAVG